MRGATKERQKMKNMHLISIHAPHAGSDICCVFFTTIPGYFNPRSPCGERHEDDADYPNFLHFNPRSPCGERPWFLYGLLTAMEFQSTLPMRGATYCLLTTGGAPIISIHAPHAGSDLTEGHGPLVADNFNPRSPCGERLR